MSMAIEASKTHHVAPSILALKRSAEEIEAWLWEADKREQPKEDYMRAVAEGERPSATPMPAAAGATAAPRVTVDKPPVGKEWRITTTQSQWLVDFLGVVDVGQGVTNADLIRRYYEKVSADLKLARLALLSIHKWDAPDIDDLGVDEDGVVHRVGEEAGARKWVLVDTLPGFRIAQGVLKWAPGTWPPAALDI